MASIKWVMNVFEGFRWGLEETDRAHPYLLDKQFFLFFSDVTTRMFTRCLMNFVQGSKLVYIGMGI